MSKKNSLDFFSQSFKGWMIVFIGGLFYLYQFMIRVSPNIMNDELMEVFSIDAGTLGSIVGVYYWAYALMQVPLGITMDRIGPRYFLCGAAFLCSMSCYIFGNTQNIYVAGLARFMMGMGSACGLIGTIKLGTIWLEPKHIAKVTALAILLGTIGAGLGGTPLKMVLLELGLEQTMELMAFIGLVVAGIIILSVRINPSYNYQQNLPDIYKNEDPLSGLWKIMRNRQAWIVAAYGMLMYVPITVIGVAWGVSFVEKINQTSELVAASVVSTMFLGAAAGSPVFALISDYFKSRRIPMVFASLVTCILWFFIVLYQNIPLSIMYVLFFIAGFTYTAKCLTFASICEVMPRSMSGTSIAFVNMIVMSTGIVFHPLVGHLLEFHWNGLYADDIPLYAESDFRFALLVIPISLLVSLFLIAFMRESHPESSIVKEYGTLIDTDVL